MDTPPPSRPPRARTKTKKQAAYAARRALRRAERLSRPRPAKAHGYHHGGLRAAALGRALEVVQRWGPDAVTLRGIARDLGVTAPALRYHFGSIAGFRASVAEAVLEQASEQVKAPPRGPGARPDLRAVARNWIAFAADNPNTYRLASGEGWHGPALTPGFHAGSGVVVPSPRRLLEETLMTFTSGIPHLRDDEGARTLAMTIHGLALARVDGAPEDAVIRALERVTA